MAGKHGTLLERFFRHVRKTDTCWLWTGSTFGHGKWRYGQIGVEGSRPKAAHRISWMLHRGPIPPGKSVLHNCPGGDNPLCVNPDHLFVGTHDDNMADAKRKGRMLRGEKISWSKLTEKDVLDVLRRLSLGESIVSITKVYSVSRGCITGIKRGRNWPHLSHKSSSAP